MGKPVFRVISPGLLTTVQDLGRPGLQRFGVSENGAMDTYSLRCANVLVGNEDGAAGLEITLQGPVLEAAGRTVVAVTGADLSPRLNGKPVPMWEAVMVETGDTLSFGGARAGSRAYLAVAGGFDVPVVLGSRSTDLKVGFGGLEGRPLRKGDLLESCPSPVQVETLVGRSLPPSVRPDITFYPEIRVVLGPQDGYFTKAGIETFLNSTYVVAPEWDRMALRLEGPVVEHREGADIISEGIPVGSVQVPKDGHPIILMAARQTIGGYTKIAVVATVDLGRVAQLRPGDQVRFQPVEVDSAQELLREQEERFRAAVTALAARARGSDSGHAGKAGTLRFRMKVKGRAYDISVEEI